MMKDVIKLAQEMKPHFGEAVRPEAAGGKTFVLLVRETSEQWMFEVVREAHGTDMLPDDWRYEIIYEGVQYLANEVDEDEDEGDVVTEFASRVDHTTSDLTQWLASHVFRPSYVDEAEVMWGSHEAEIQTMIAWGQEYERREIFERLCMELREIAEDEDEDEDEDDG